MREALLKIAKLDWDKRGKHPYREYRQRVRDIALSALWISEPLSEEEVARIRALLGIGEPQ